MQQKSTGPASGSSYLSGAIRDERRRCEVEVGLMGYVLRVRGSGVHEKQILTRLLDQSSPLYTPGFPTEPLASNNFMVDSTAVLCGA